jgi:hypothetical protein
MPDLTLKQRFTAIVADTMSKNLPRTRLNQIADGLPPAVVASTPNIAVYVFAAAAGEPGAESVAEALRKFGGADGRLHIRDPFAGVAGGGKDHVFDIPAGATHVQIFFHLTAA